MQSSTSAQIACAVASDPASSVEYTGGFNFDSRFWQASATRASARFGKRSESSEYAAQLADQRTKRTMYGAGYELHSSAGVIRAT